MRRALIVSPVRTAVGTFGGALRAVPAEELATVVVRETVARAGVDPARIDDVVLAQSYANSEAPCIGRWAALNAGLPLQVPGMQLDRRCGGGLQAIISAAMMVQTGAADVVLAGGVESMSNVEHYTQDVRWGRRSGGVELHDRLDRGRQRSQPEGRFGPISGMIETAENLAQEYQVSREAADEFAAESHRRAAAAQANGRFDEEIVAVDVPQRRGEALRFEQDEASQQNDGAAACLIVAEETAESLDLHPIAALVGWAASGCDPARMGIGPVPAVAKLFARTGLGFDDLDLIELNEAFAVQVLAVLRCWNWDDRSRLNVNGSGISLGHPIGATGARIMTTMLYELARRAGRFALETMCIGGGQGLAAIFERV